MNTRKTKKADVIYEQTLIKFPIEYDLFAFPV